MFSQCSSFLAMALIALAATFAVTPKASAAPPVSPYAGSWSGPFTTDIEAWGYVTFNVAANGQVSGRATYYPGGITGTLVGHVNENGFGAFIFHRPPQVIPYLLYLSINAEGNLEMVAPTPWSDGFTVFATLHQ